MPKKSSHGGPREGAGRKPKDESAGPRVAITVKVHPDTRMTLQVEATPQQSQGEIIDEAVNLWRATKADQILRQKRHEKILASLGDQKPYDPALDFLGKTKLKVKPEKTYKNNPHLP